MAGMSRDSGRPQNTVLIVKLRVIRDIPKVTDTIEGSIDELTEDKARYVRHPSI